RRRVNSQLTVELVVVWEFVLKIPVVPPQLSGIIQSSTPAIIAKAVQAEPTDSKGRYLHWDDMRHRVPPEGLNHEEWWLGTKLTRDSIAREIPLTSTTGARFRFVNTDWIQESVHRIDQRAGGQILTDDPVTNLRSRDRYLVSSLTEEAI